MPPAMVLLHVANVAAGMFLGCLLSHPLLNSVTVRADTDPPVLDMEAAKEARKKSRTERTRRR